MLHPFGHLRGLLINLLKLYTIEWQLFSSTTKNLAALKVSFWSSLKKTIGEENQTFLCFGQKTQ